jgi:hypothetical protein
VEPDPFFTKRTVISSGATAGGVLVETLHPVAGWALTSVMPLLVQEIVTDPPAALKVACFEAAVVVVALTVVDGADVAAGADEVGADEVAGAAEVVVRGADVVVDAVVGAAGGVVAGDVADVGGFDDKGVAATVDNVVVVAGAVVDGMVDVGPGTGTVVSMVFSVAGRPPDTGSCVTSSATDSSATGLVAVDAPFDDVVVTRTTLSR